MPGNTFDLVVAANRLAAMPVTDPDGNVAWRRSPGGLVSALEPVMRGRRAAWVGWAGVAGTPPDPQWQDPLLLCPVPLSPREVEDHYEGFSNSTVWPLFHDLAAPPVFRRDWWEAYREVNDRFARAVARLAGPAATVWVHDYHLQLVPRLLRDLRPDVRIGWFDHIPFPPVELFARLPWRGEILEGLLGADFLGFQRWPDADNFLRCCRRLLGLRAGDDAVTTPAPDASAGSRTVRVGSVPISVDFAGLDALARSPEVTAGARHLRDDLGGPDLVLLGLDRLDYTKGIRHRLEAYEGLLRDGALAPFRAVLLQASLPSRERIDAYRRLRAEVEASVRGLNARFTVGGSPAVRLVEEHCSRTEVASMHLAADAILVTSVRDGMNLVAKEYVACRHDLGGALVLSEFTGAWHELPEAFPCNPHDIDGLKETIVEAVTTPAPERRRRMAALRARVAAHDVHLWAQEFLDALARA